MTKTTTTASLLLAAAFALTTQSFATQAFAQAPSEAQRAAIKSNCRSDYMAHCSSIPPGGAASLECLQKNMASLSASCASAVRAVEAPAAAPKTAEEPKAEPKAEPKTETKTETKTGTKAEPVPAAKDARPAAEPKAAGAAQKPSQAQISAIKSNCRSDYPKVCADVPPGGEPALACLEKNKAKVSAACARAVATAGGAGAASGGGSAGAAAATAAAPVAPAAIVLRPMRPREELFVLRSACGGDVRSLCAGVPVGGGRIIQCLASQTAALSPACKDVLSQFAR
jgi:hypothetical protein